VLVWCLDHSFPSPWLMFSPHAHTTRARLQTLFSCVGSRMSSAAESNQHHVRAEPSPRQSRQL